MPRGARCSSWSTSRPICTDRRYEIPTRNFRKRRRDNPYSRKRAKKSTRLPENARKSQNCALGARKLHWSTHSKGKNLCRNRDDGREIGVGRRGKMRDGIGVKKITVANGGSPTGGAQSRRRNTKRALAERFCGDPPLERGALGARSRGPYIVGALFCHVSFKANSKRTNPNRQCLTPSSPHPPPPARPSRPRRRSRARRREAPRRWCPRIRRPRRW